MCAEGRCGAQLPHVRGGLQAHLSGLQEDPREVALTEPGLGLDKAMMLGYLWVHNRIPCVWI